MSKLEDFKKYHNVTKDINLNTKVIDGRLFVIYNNKKERQLSQNVNKDNFFNISTLRMRHGIKFCRELGITSPLPTCDNSYFVEYYRENKKQLLAKKKVQYKKKKGEDEFFKNQIYERRVLDMASLRQSMSADRILRRRRIEPGLNRIWWKRGFIERCSECDGIIRVKVSQSQILQSECNSCAYDDRPFGWCRADKPPCRCVSKNIDCIVLVCEDCEKELETDGWTLFLPLHGRYLSVSRLMT
jgi:hypothetical protein